MQNLSNRIWREKNMLQLSETKLVIFLNSSYFAFFSSLYYFDYQTVGNISFADFHKTYRIWWNVSIIKRYNIVFCQHKRWIESFWISFLLEKFWILFTSNASESEHKPKREPEMITLINSNLANNASTIRFFVNKQVFRSQHNVRKFVIIENSFKVNELKVFRDRNIRI